MRRGGGIDWGWQIVRRTAYAALQELVKTALTRLSLKSSHANLPARRRSGTGALAAGPAAERRTRGDVAAPHGRRAPVAAGGRLRRGRAGPGPARWRRHGAAAPAAPHRPQAAGADHHGPRRDREPPRRPGRRRRRLPGQALRGLRVTGAAARGDAPLARLRGRRGRRRMAAARPGAGRAAHGSAARRRARVAVAHGVQPAADPGEAAGPRRHPAPAGEPRALPDGRPQPRRAHLQPAPQDRRRLYPHGARRRLPRGTPLSAAATGPAPAQRSLFRRSMGAVLVVLFLTWAALVARELIDIGLLQVRNGQAENALW